MDKESKQANLFNQALVLAMKEGKVQFSKDADPYQSGIVGENYLLFSKQRKLLISIPLENLKRNTRKENNYPNSFVRKMQWFIYGFFGLTTINLLLTCDETPSHYFFISISFFFLHWLALKISQGSGVRDKKIKILRDPALYWMYVALIICLVLILLLQIAAIVRLDFYALFAFPFAAFWGRVSQIFAIGNYKYIFKNDSDSIHKKYWQGTSSEIIPSLLIICLGIIFFLFSINFNLSNIFLLISFILSGFISSILIPYFINKSLGGHNGDSYGAGLVITETTHLLLLSIILVPS